MYLHLIPCCWLWSGFLSALCNWWPLRKRLLAEHLVRVAVWAKLIGALMHAHLWDLQVLHTSILLLWIQCLITALMHEVVHHGLMYGLLGGRLLIWVRDLVKLAVCHLRLAGLSTSCLASCVLSLRLLIREESACLASHGCWTRPHAWSILAVGFSTVISRHHIDASSTRIQICGLAWISCAHILLICWCRRTIAVIYILGAQLTILLVWMIKLHLSIALIWYIGSLRKHLTLVGRLMILILKLVH